MQPIYGRAFLPQEDQPGRNKEIILSCKLWQSRFGSDPAVVGRTMTLDGTPYMVVGVMGPKMTKPTLRKHGLHSASPLKKPPCVASTITSPSAASSPATDSQAQAEMNTISHRLEQTYPADDKGWGATVNSMREDLVGDVRRLC